MKHESTFRKKTKSEEVVSSEEHLKPEKRIAKKHPDAKPRKSKIKSRRMLKKPAVQKPLRMPLAVLIKKHERQKIKAKIENAIVKNEAKKNQGC